MESGSEDVRETGFDGRPESELEANIQKKTGSATGNKEPFDPVVYAKKYVMESCFMAFFAVCFVVLFVGKRHNAAIAQLWH